MPAELIRGLDCDTPSIPIELMRKRAVEQTGRQLDPADQLQLGQFILNAGQARLARIAAQPQKQCRSSSRGLTGPGIAGFVRGGEQQRIQPAPCRWSKAAQNAGTEALIMGMDRGADDPIDTISRGRLDRKLTTPGFEERNKLIRARPHGRHLISQPLFEQVGVGNRCFSEAKQSSDLGPMPLPCPAGCIVSVVAVGLHAKLSSHSRHGPRLNFRRLFWKLPMCSIK